MKKIFLLIILAGAITTAANAQRVTGNHPHWTFSKEVVKARYSHVLYTPAVITTAQAPAVAKGIALLQADRRAALRQKVQIAGKPSFVISKPVARMQYDRNKR